MYVYVLNFCHCYIRIGCEIKVCVLENIIKYSEFMCIAIPHSFHSHMDLRNSLDGFEVSYKICFFFFVMVTNYITYFYVIKLYVYERGTAGMMDLLPLVNYLNQKIDSYIKLKSFCVL